MPHIKTKIRLRYLEINLLCCRLSSTIFLILCTTTLFTQSFKPSVTQLQFEEKDKSLKTFFQDTTGLMWILNHYNWYISDGEQIFNLPISLEFGPESYITGFVQNGNKLYLGGDSLRIFNPYTRKFEKSIGLSNDLNFGDKRPYINMPIVLEDGSIFGISRVINPINKNEDYTYVLSKDGQPFQQLEKPVSSNFRNGVSFSIRGNQLFVSKTDSIIQYELNGKFVKTFSFEKFSKLPICDGRYIPNDVDVSFIHFTKDDKTGKAKETRYVLKPGADDFVMVEYPDFQDYPGSFTKQGSDYYKIELDQLDLFRFRQNESPTNFSELILNKYPELSYTGDYIHHIKKDRSNSLWASSFLNDIFRFSNINQPFTQYLTLQEDNPTNRKNRFMLRGISSDNNGNLYIAYDFGVKKLEIRTGKITEFSFDLSDKVETANSLTYFKGKLYFNAIEIDPKTGTCKELVPNLTSHRVTHYIDTLRNTIWIADAAHWDDLNESILLYQYDLISSKLTSFTTLQGPSRIDNEVSQFHLSQSTQTMFVATISDGIHELDLNGNKLNQYLNDDDVLFKRCLSLYEDEDNQLWIGNGRISKLDLKTREISHAPFNDSKNTFHASNVFSIQRQNETYVWLGTNTGIFRLNILTGELQDFKMISNISVKEFNRLSHWQDENGNMYFGSVEGLFKFHPDSVLNFSQLDKTFPIRISRFSTYDNRNDSLVHHFDNLSNTFHIRPYHKYFSFDIFSPDLRNPEKNKYSWWLEGYDNSWSKLSILNYLRYENIPPGEYTLHIKGGLSPHYYQTSQRSYKIIVHQVWYKTKWAILAYLILLSGFVYGIYQYQLKRKLAEAESKRFKELDQLKTRLYTNITHEFRTPLTVIMGMTNNIKDHPEESKLIQRNSKNLLRLINQLLDLSKLDSGSLKMDKIQAEIIHYLQYLTESFYSMADEKHIRLTFYSEVKELMMDYDETKIQHIIYNLLTNAIKFSLEGGKVILHVKKIVKNNSDYLQLKISDNGIGISKENLPKIFDRFFQGDGSATRREAGTGIGLALTKELIEMMEGEINVESKLGEGSNFQILLPIKLEQETITKAITELDHHPKIQIDKIETKKSRVIPLDLNKLSMDAEKPSLLIIEDNRDVVTYIEGLLIKNYRIEIAKNGQEGIDKALSIVPDIIISDVMMPKKDGYQVCTALKNDERTSHIPIILLTAKAALEDRVEGLKEGADAYLTKPFAKEELFIRLAQLVMIRKTLQERYSKTNLFAKAPISNSNLSLDDLFLQKLIEIIKPRINDSNLSVSDLCDGVKLSNTHVNRKLKALTGRTPSQFIRAIRLQKALELLKTTDQTISEIAYDVGFNDPNYFSRSFSDEFGFTPKSTRK